MDENNKHITLELEFSYNIFIYWYSGGVAVNWDNDAVDDGASEVGSEHTYNEDSQSGFNFSKKIRQDGALSSDEDEWANQDADMSYKSNMADNLNDNAEDGDSNDGYNVENEYDSDGEETASDNDDVDGQLQWDATTYTEPVNEDSVPFAHYASYPSIGGNGGNENDQDYDYDD